MKLFLKWAIVHLLILFFRLVRWLAEEAIEELERHVRRPQVRKATVKPQNKKTSPKYIPETNTLEWGKDAVEQTELSYYKTLAKKRS